MSDCHSANNRPFIGALSGFAMLSYTAPNQNDKPEGLLLRGLRWWDGLSSKQLRVAELWKLQKIANPNKSINEISGYKLSWSNYACLDSRDYGYEFVFYIYYAASSDQLCSLRTPHIPGHLSVLPVSRWTITAPKKKPLLLLAQLLD